MVQALVVVAMNVSCLRRAVTVTRAHAVLVSLSAVTETLVLEAEAIVMCALLLAVTGTLALVEEVRIV